MTRLTSLFVGLLAAVSASASPSKRSLEPANLLGEIIDALGIGLVTQINASITVRNLVRTTVGRFTETGVFSSTH
jgi:hypothetical protein